MPLYLYVCQACRHEFETLVRAGSEPACPKCQSRELERQPSTFAVKSADRTRAIVDKKLKRDGEVGWQKTAEIERDAERHRREDH
jgi:putative FmdB family regulatory protein